MNDLRSNRKAHQRVLARKRKRLRKRRRLRVRRVKFWRAIRSTLFWTNVSCYLIIFMAIVFWAKFAFVYNIPSYVQRGNLQNVSMYVAVKPWWFGPPVFDLKSYDNHTFIATVSQRQNMLFRKLDKYQQIITQPRLIWVDRIKTPGQ